jgi:translation initiation factor 3 subunit A
MDRAGSGRGEAPKENNGEPLKPSGAPGKYVPKFRREG